MPSWEGKSKGTAAGYRIFVAILRFGGVLPAYSVLYFVALYYYLFSFRTSIHIYRYLRKLGQGKLRAFLNIYRNYYLFGQSLLDKVVIMSGIKNRFTYNFDGEDNLKEMVSGGKGGILVSAHIGNWEAAGHFLNRLDTKVHVVMYDAEHKQIKRYLETVTGGHAFNVILIRDDVSHIYEISEALGNNEIICIHADRFLPGNRTVATSFLGEDALFPVGPFVLATKFKVPVSYVYAMKESVYHYHLFATSLKTYNHNSKWQSIQEMLSDYVKGMEDKVRRYPLQWYNYYDFWEKSKHE